MDRWEAQPDLPDVLPGEDRTYGQGLFVDLIPRTSWFTNVRSAVDRADWDRLRRMVYRRAGYCCEACHTSGVQLEAHERFTYDAQTGLQRLIRLICLCQWCHTATHMGFAGVRGVADEATAHLIAVTGISPAEADQHIDEAFDRWYRRSAQPWHVDLSMIAAAGIRLRQAPQAQVGPVLGEPAAPEAAAASEGVLLVTTVVEFVPYDDPASAREISDAERALQASYEKYADQLAEIEALRSGRRPV
jgi:hypothetical protein